MRCRCSCSITEKSLSSPGVPAQCWMDVCLLILNNEVLGLSSVRLEMKHDDIYQKFFAINPTPMWISDRETQRFLVVNDAAVRNYGYSREEFLGLTLKDIRPAEIGRASCRERV